MIVRQEVIDRAIALYNTPCYYAWGGGHDKFFWKEFNGVRHRGLDCSGFCSGALWGYDDVRNFQSVTSGYFFNNRIDGFNDIKPGDFLVKSGHCAVYLGEMTAEAYSWSYRAYSSNGLGMNYKPTDFSRFVGYYRITDDGVGQNPGGVVTPDPYDPGNGSGIDDPGNADITPDDGEDGDTNGICAVGRYTKDIKRNFHRGKITPFFLIL